MSNDLSNNQLLNAIADMFARQTEIMVTKDDLRASESRIKTELRNEFRHDLNNGLAGLEARLSRKLDNHKRVNIQHHLETRAMIGALNSGRGHSLQS